MKLQERINNYLTEETTQNKISRLIKHLRDIQNSLNKKDKDHTDTINNLKFSKSFLDDVIKDLNKQ